MNCSLAEEFGVTADPNHHFTRIWLSRKIAIPTVAQIATTRKAAMYRTCVFRRRSILGLFGKSNFVNRSISPGNAHGRQQNVYRRIPGRLAIEHLSNRCRPSRLLDPQTKGHPDEIPNRPQTASHGLNRQVTGTSNPVDRPASPAASVLNWIQPRHPGRCGIGYGAVLPWNSLSKRTVHSNPRAGGSIPAIRHPGHAASSAGLTRVA